jgi:hypothetical protein
VFTDSGRVVFIAPPGETAVLTVPEARRLRAVLWDAVVDAVAETSPE